MKPVASSLKVLTREQALAYHESGVVCPLSALSGEETRHFRAQLADLQARPNGLLPAGQMHQPPLFFRWAYDLVTHPAILDAVEDVIGSDILVHSTTIFNKRPRSSGYVPWHQDGFYWELSSPKLLSAWVALSPSNRDNGCLRVIPGTHRDSLRHEERRHANSMIRSGMTVMADFQESDALDLVLEPGQISLHNVNLIHGSNPNPSDVERVGFAIRYVAPEVQQNKRHHPVILARGKDSFGHYEHLPTPPSEDVEQGIADQLAFSRAWHAQG